MRASAERIIVPVEDSSDDPRVPRRQDSHPDCRAMFVVASCGGVRFGPDQPFRSWRTAFQSLAPSGLRRQTLMLRCARASAARSPASSASKPQSIRVRPKASSHCRTAVQTPDLPSCQADFLQFWQGLAGIRQTATTAAAAATNMTLPGRHVKTNARNHQDLRGHVADGP